MEHENEILDANIVEKEIEFYPTNGGNRFGNYFIDGIVCRIGVYLVGLVFPTEGVAYLYMWVPFLLVYFGYYIFFEAVFGKTIGKMITRTHVVTVTGEKPEVSAIILRTLCRLIPFEQFSFLGNSAVGWHDSLSKTRVVAD